jgi:penicillin amidase
MRVIPFIVTAAITGVLIWFLNKPIGETIPMPLGSFLSPQTGFWQNAEDTSYDFSSSLNFLELKDKVSVYMDERLVPHVFAENDEDLYFVQGYLHARFRLFQMDLQTKAAEGRASEIAGAKAIAFDKEQRRLGMKFAAENSLVAMEKDDNAKKMYSSYTAGINAYIHSLKQKDLPIEYKLLNFQPEEWTNLRTALLLKMMAKMLSSGTERDLAYTNLKSVLSNAQINAIYPQVPDSLVPIVPQGTPFPKPIALLKEPVNADSAYFDSKTTAIAFEEFYKPNPDNGSNNWVVAGSKTQSGAPILCNDPHLELSLPSIWYEIQLTTPELNVYGASLPGSPFVIIGFNDSISWGVTNAQRDVKDYYAIKFRDDSKKEYWYNNEWKPVAQRIEEIMVKNGPAIFDTVAYTVFGPIMHDRNFADSIAHFNALAVKWVAHHTGDDGITFFNLNRAKNYPDYAEAIKAFECPGQNFVFASKTGDIAIWQQGKFPDRWNGQGRYVMPGTDSSYLWQGFIPQTENPHALNPARGFLESANQRPADATYPFYIPGSYITPRGIAIEHFLSQMNRITTRDMMKLQDNYFNVMAEDMKPMLLKYVNESALNTTAKKYLNEFKNWDLNAEPESVGQTIYQIWVDSLQKGIWYDELSKAGPVAPIPEEQTTMELLRKDSTLLGFVDDINTAGVETIHDQVTIALNKTSETLEKAEKGGRLQWTKFKDVTIYHLLGKTLMAFARPGLNVGGWNNIINAVTKSHGPSWRMIVQMTKETEAYGVYPGGQSGNPGSKFYDNAVDTWVAGKYYPLWMMKKEEEKDNRVKWIMKFDKI